MTGFLGDLRYAIRMLWKQPAISAVAILSLAIGLGANATVFSFVNAFLLRPLPVAQPDRLVEIWDHRMNAQNAFMSHSTIPYPDYLYYRDHNQVFGGVAAFIPEMQTVSWQQNGEPPALWLRWFQRIILQSPA